MNMKKYVYVLLTLALFAASSEFLNAEDTIQLSDEYFDIYSSDQKNAAPQAEGITTADAEEISDDGILSIRPAPNWTLKRERENKLIGETSFNNNSPDAIITREGLAPAEHITSAMTQAVPENALTQNQSGNPAPAILAQRNEKKRSGGAVPKTLRVRHETQPKAHAADTETELGDWVFDFPK